MVPILPCLAAVVWWYNERKIGQSSTLTRAVGAGSNNVHLLGIGACIDATLPC
jgi:hypothetical protein